MPFPKMSIPLFPLRQWALIGEPDSGKSAFLMQMQAPVLAIDPDHRIGSAMKLLESKGLVVPDVFMLSENPRDHLDALTITELLRQHMPGSGVKTIGVDSLTNYLAPQIAEAQLAHERALELAKADPSYKDARKNLAAAFKDKAQSMRLLTTSINAYGVAVLYIWHKGEARNQSGDTIERETVSKLERARIKAQLSAHLEIVIDDKTKKRGIKVAWCRDGRSGMTLWDDSGYWSKMPERIEAEMYAGLTAEERKKISDATPKFFSKPEDAWAWSVRKGAYADVLPAQSAYARIRDDAHPENAVEMAALWVAHVEERLAEKAGTPSDTSHQTDLPF